MSNIHPMAALKAAIRTRLLDDPALAAFGGRIHDGPPRNSTMPFLAMADGVARENATNEAVGFVVELDIGIFTKERGSAEGLALARAAEMRLDSGVNPAGWRLVLLTLRESLVRQDAAAGTARVALRYRAFIEAI